MLFAEVCSAADVELGAAEADRGALRRFMMETLQDPEVVARYATPSPAGPVPGTPSFQQRLNISSAFCTAIPQLDLPFWPVGCVAKSIRFSQKSYEYSSFNVTV